MSMKRGEGNGLLEGTVIYWVILLMFAGILGTFVLRHQGTTDRWEDYYAFVIAQTIDKAQPGDVIVLDVSAPVQIGARNKVATVDEMFVLQEGRQEVGVRLRAGKAHWYSYLRDVSVSNWHVDRAGEKVTLVFEVGA